MDWNIYKVTMFLIKEAWLISHWLAYFGFFLFWKTRKLY